MKTIWVYIAIAVLAGTMLAISVPVQADPWPDYISQTSEVDYVEILGLYNGGYQWSYYMTIDPTPVDSHGTFVGIKALAVYPNAGETATGPTQWDAVATGWSSGPWEGKAFGYSCGSPASYITAGASDVLIGTAQYPSGYMPEDQTVLVHVVLNEGAYTYWARPGYGEIVPEPSSLLVLGVAGMSLFGFIARKRRSA